MSIFKKAGTNALFFIVSLLLAGGVMAGDKSSGFSVKLDGGAKARTDEGIELS